MNRIITIAGSNSQKSINKSLISYTINLLDQADIIDVDLNDYKWPIFGIDYEEENGIPISVKELDTLFDSADGFIISLAEHNGAYSTAFKNFIDWLSRVNQNVWKEKPMLLMATSPGNRGGMTVLQTASSYFPFMGSIITDTFSLPRFFDNFSDGEIIDSRYKEDLYKKIKKFEQNIQLSVLN